MLRVRAIKRALRLLASGHANLIMVSREGARLNLFASSTSEGIVIVHRARLNGFFRPVHVIIRVLMLFLYSVHHPRGVSIVTRLESRAVLLIAIRVDLLRRRNVIISIRGFYSLKLLVAKRAVKMIRANEPKCTLFNLSIGRAINST